MIFIFIQLLSNLELGATYDVFQEIRNDHLSIEEGKKLIKKYENFQKDILKIF